VEKKLKIFYPKNSFGMHKTTKIFLFLVLAFFLTHYSKRIFPENYENLDLLNFVIIVVIITYSLFYIIYNFFRHEYENGTFSGYLIIENDKIICDNKVYSIGEIEKVSILNYSIRGKFNGKISALEAKRSNGLKNYIEIICNNKINKYYFLQTKTENIKIIKSELKTYFEKGLIGEQNYKNLIS
jgi:hypothetical protein